MKKSNTNSRKTIKKIINNGMKKSMQKKVSLSIDDQVWSDYIEKLEKNTGVKKGKGHIGPTIEKLIRQYYLKDQEEDNQQQETIDKQQQQITQQHIGYGFLDMNLEYFQIEEM